MIVLNTVAHETIWGGQKLLSYSSGEHKIIGHLYSLCCEKGLENIILNGIYKGETFQKYFNDMKERFGLGGYKEFPLIIALVEAKDNLSIQVHPNDEMAVAEEKAQYGKNESWYFLKKPDSGYIFNGCLVSDINEIRQKMNNNQLMSVVDHLEVDEGDYVYVEAGTLHALSAGSYLYEIEENSPWTYRMYDYDRTDLKGNKRQLHIEKAVRALNVNLKSKAIKLGECEQSERRYSIKSLKNLSSYINESETLECITFIHGGCDLYGIAVKPGMTVVLEPGEEILGDISLAMMARPK